MAVETKTIKMRRGKESELDKSKLLAGEFGIATDTQKVFIGMGSGKTKELASREDVQTLIDNFGNVVDAEIEYATKEIREEGERVLATIPDDFETTAAKADEAVRTKSDAITLTESGERITNPMTSNDPMRGLKLYGKGEQRKTTGKQLLDAYNLTPSNSGTKCTIEEEGRKITLSTKTITMWPAIACNADILIGKTFYVFGEKEHSIVEGYSELGYVQISYVLNGANKYIENIPIDGKNKYSVPDDAMNVKFRILFRNEDTTIPADIFVTYTNLLITETQGATWEPYTGGQPSPSLDYPQEIETCGKVGNLLDLADKTITTETYVYEKVPVSIPKGIYTFSCKHNLRASLGWWLTFYNENGINIGGTGTQKGNINSVTFEVTEDATSASLYFNGAVTVNNIMLNEGTTALPYRPYNGGQKEIETELLTGNLLKNTAVSQTINGVTFTVNDDGSVTMNGTATGNAQFWLTRDFVFKANKKYNISGGKDTNILVRINDGTTIFATDKGGGASYTPNEDIVLGVDIRIASGAVVNTTVYPMIRLASDPNTEYVPYSRQSHITTVPNGLPGIEVTDASLANYVDSDGRMWCCDEVDYERGVYVQRIAHHYLDGSAVPTQYIQIGNAMRFGWQGGKYNIAPKNYEATRWQMCNRFTPSFAPLHSNDVDGAIGTYTSGGIYIRCDAVNSKEAMAEYLASNPVEYLYVMKTPIETPLPESEIAAYRALHSNYPTTNISNDCNAGMEVSMNADLKTYIDNKIAEISTAILNN